MINEGKTSYKYKSIITLRIFLTPGIDGGLNKLWLEVLTAKK